MAVPVSFAKITSGSRCGDSCPCDRPNTPRLSQSWAVPRKEGVSVGWNGGRKGRQCRWRVGAVWSAGRGWVCRPPPVSMMQAADFGKLHDRARLRTLDGPHVWGILFEREVRLDRQRPAAAP